MITNPAIKVAGQRKGRALFRLLEDMRVEIAVSSTSSFVVRVPRNYETDFASIPRGLWSIFPPTGEYLLEAIVHDYLCTDRVDCSRFFADCTFRELMRLRQVKTWKRVVMFYAVRLMSLLRLER